jgi:ATP-dependent DNA helicase RecG
MKNAINNDDFKFINDAKFIKDIKFIKGVGPKRVEILNKIGIYSIEDLVTYFPVAYINRESTGSVSEIRYSLRNQFNSQFNISEKFNIPDQNNLNDNFINFSLPKEISIIGKIVKQQLKEIKNRKKMLILTVVDFSNEEFEIVFFSMAEYFKSLYLVDFIIVVSGKPILNKRTVSFSHPEIDVIEEEDIDFYGKGGIIPKYKINDEMRKAGITIRVMRKIISNALDIYNENINSFFIEGLPESIIKKLELPTIDETISVLHRPQNMQQIQAAKYRIKFEELFWYQLLLNINRTKISQKENGILIEGKSKLARKLYDSLPFELTSDQKKVLREFAQDFTSSKPMNRLLQGDVGSGKTIVAILTMLMVIDAGYQVVMMAPTELLAEQHFFTISRLFHNIKNNINNNFQTVRDFQTVDNSKTVEENFNRENTYCAVKNIEDLAVDILLGGTRKTARNEILERIETGKTNIVIGTHALFQSDVKYNNLGLVIIDEQHRFGVSQRAELIELAKNSMQNQELSPHILFMTATPIPRTMTMMLYGDLDISLIKIQPKNRLPIKTRVLFDSERIQVFEFIRKELNKGRQAYIVFPLVEKSEKLELKSAIEHYEVIANEIFPDFKCGLLHGQMKWQEKEEIMISFKENEFQVLVATTVVEVGIDVPNANVMVIEDSERFGLSQLHQLRGRVGRGNEQSYCFLMTKDNFKYKFTGRNAANAEDEKVNENKKKKTMQETTDGFKLSEIDLKLRGPGDMLGTKQSGIPEFKYADLINDVEIVQTSSTVAKQIAVEDPNLEKIENKKLKEYFQKHNEMGIHFINIA